MLHRLLFCSIVFLLSHALPAVADGPQDNNARTVRPVPPRGIDVPESVAAEFKMRLDDFEKQIALLKTRDPLKIAMAAVIPRAVRMTIESNMIYSEKEFARMMKQLDEADRRVRLLRDGDVSVFDLLGLPTVPLKESTLVVGGFKSALDHSVQPYGVVFPKGWSRDNPTPARLDVWLHGRGENVSESAFLEQRTKVVGEYAPENTIVLHPYGRYCNAFKFAGEVDVIEAMQHLKSFVPIDKDRITIRGFSMGGAGCWQLAVHYPELWAAANPGAGFSETTQFLKVFQNEEFKPTSYQRDLLHWYDCPDWTNNLRNVPTIAYSGEIDRQKQAADVMAEAFAQRGMNLPHVIGPDTAHKIHADSKVAIEDFLQKALAKSGTNPYRPVDLTTYLLRYHELHWLSIEGLEEHWREARVTGQIERNTVQLTTKNVTRLRLRFDKGLPGENRETLPIEIDGEFLKIRFPRSDSTPTVWLTRDKGTWIADREPHSEVFNSLRKRPGLQGPIDDAFMGQFAFVPPVVKNRSEGTTITGVDKWVSEEYAHATSQWKIHFRGDIIEVDAERFTDSNLEQNLILFGTPKTNPLIRRILDKLPIQWSSDTLVINGKSYSAESHVPVLIFPNPLSPDHYVVLNSGFTYREYAYLNNARQIPMLPDWAVVDISGGSDTQSPGDVVDAGFFDEKWSFKE